MPFVLTRQREHIYIYISDQILDLSKTDWPNPPTAILPAPRRALIP